MGELRLGAARACALATALALGGFPAVARAAQAPATLEDVVARHIASHGGAQRWAEIRALEISGSMTWLSQPSPFTLWKQPGGYYLLDSLQGGQHVLTGFDGEESWRGSAGPPVLAQRLAGLDAAMVAREGDFPTPLFAGSGGRVELSLMPSADFEGRPALGVKVARADGLEEIWYLDPQNCLEMGRDSPGSDFGRQVPMRTYFDDFRTVEGVTLPFRIESQWHVQERILSVSSVKINPPVEQARFHRPRPEGMEPLMPLAGRWKVTASQSAHPGAPWRDTERTSAIESLLEGALLQERYTASNGQEVIRSYTYDRFRGRYRVTEIGAASGYLDVQEGVFDGEGRLVLSNVQTGTPIEASGHTVHVRTTIRAITPGGFTIEKEISTDGGAAWTLMAKAAYSKIPA